MSRFVPGPPVGPWSPGRRPSVAHAYDDEFDGPTLTGWTDEGTFSAAEIDPFAAFTSGGCRRSLTRRPGWLLLQAPADHTAGAIGPGLNSYGISKSVTVPTNFCLWVRASFGHRSNTVADNDGALGVFLTAQTAGGAVDPDNRIGIWATENDASVVHPQFERVQGGTLVAITPANNFQRISGIEYFGIQKIGTSYYGWVMGASGVYMVLGSAGLAFTPTPAKIWIVTTNVTSGQPGNMVVGLDFVRCVEGKHLP